MVRKPGAVVSVVLLLGTFLPSGRSQEAPDLETFLADGAPELLSETCLYDDIGRFRVSPRLTKFTPNYRLWTDGAKKTRWVYLPPGSRIDTEDPNRWVFPRVAIVYLPEDEGLEFQPILDHYDSDFTKRSIVGTPGEEILLKNSDEIGHTIYAESEAKGIPFWDVDFMPAHSSAVRKISWEDGEFIELKCKIHTYMKSCAGAIKSRYHEIIEFEEGQREFVFNLKRFPAIYSKVKIWIPDYEPIELSLTPGAEASRDLVRKGTVRGTVELTRSEAEKPEED